MKEGEKKDLIYSRLNKQCKFGLSCESYFATSRAACMHIVSKQSYFLPSRCRGPSFLARTNLEFSRRDVAQRGTKAFRGVRFVTSLSVSCKSRAREMGEKKKTLTLSLCVASCEARLGYQLLPRRGHLFPFRRF